MAKEEVAPKRNLQQFFVPVLVALAIGLAFFSGTLWQKVKNLEKGGGTVAQATVAPTPVVSIDTIKGLFAKDFIKFGDTSRKILFVEIADPSCPFCHVAGGHNPEVALQMDPSGRFKYVSAGGAYQPPVPEMKKLVDSGQASYLYIYYPGHGSGVSATKALYCANEQGKFWPVHDLLMSNAGYILMNTTMAKDSSNHALDNSANQTLLINFLKIAIDPVFLKGCLASGKYDAKLTSDTATGQDLSKYFGQYFGTPAFFINTTDFGGAYSWTDMKSAVDAALK